MKEAIGLRLASLPAPDQTTVDLVRLEAMIQRGDGRSAASAEAIDRAQALLEGLDAADPLLRARLAMSRALVLERGIDSKAAFESAGRALEIFGSLDPRSVETADALALHARLRADYGDAGRAETLAALRRALEIKEEAHGREHSEVLLPMEYLIDALTDDEMSSAERVECEELVDRYKRIAVTVYGEDTIPWALAKVEEYYFLDATDRQEEARDSLYEALRVARNLGGEPRFTSWFVIDEVGWYEQQLGNYEVARELLEESLAMAKRLEAPEAVQVSYLSALYLAEATDRRDDALNAVEGALATGLPPEDLEDPDLEALWEDPRFRELVETARRGAATPP